MNDVEKQVEELNNTVAGIFEKLQIAQKMKELRGYQDRMVSPDFWSDSNKAQDVSRKASKLEKFIQPWLDLQQDVSEMREFILLGDETLLEDIKEKLETTQKSFDQLKELLKFSGKHDDSDAVITIQSGAGGLDAQDWAAMLLRMYSRWADQNDDFEAKLIQETTAEEAGIKNATIQVSGSYAYGKLKGEHGVHRLVRLSPFNTANSRETSFAMVEVIPQVDSPEEIEVDEKDLRVDVYRAGGHGGQSVNTTDSAVRITHLPTGITVAIQNERSQIQNKDKAMMILKSKLVQLAEEQHADKIADLKGPNQEAAWGNQIRSYVLHPYTMVKDGRSNFETSDVQKVLDGNLDLLIEAYIDSSLGDEG